MPQAKRIEIPITGMDCAECTRHVQRALQSLESVEAAEVFLAGEKAILHLRDDDLDPDAVRRAVAKAGYAVPDETQPGAQRDASEDLSRTILGRFGWIFGAVLLIVVVGEWLGALEALTQRIPWPIGAGLVLVIGFPVFRNVFRAALDGRILSHTLMTVGAIAALAVGEWATAAVVAFFMRVGDYVESFTAERARRSVRSLAEMAPQTARVIRDGAEVEVPVQEVQIGENVVVRPGERIPVDGSVVEGRATVDQSHMTGESMPVEAGPGTRVYAASLAQLGSLRVQATHVGADTTFGRVIAMVEEAEAHRGDVQRVADRFSAYYLPVVAGIAALTYLIGRDPLATAAVLVVACSCSIALATPIAMLASIGAAARRGLLIKGGKYLETLAQADVVLIDKTGTLTLGTPRIRQVRPLNGLSETELIALAAAAERDSEHPLAGAIRQAARSRGVTIAAPQTFEALPGRGVRARVDGHEVLVGRRGLIEETGLDGEATALENEGYTVLAVVRDGQAAGLMAAEDALRPEVPAALEALRTLGIRHMELLTGDNEPVAAALADQLEIPYQAELLPEDKIRIVKGYQAEGKTVVMIGDGVNDAPALAQADVGIAMGAAGSDVALEAAHVALMRDDWALVPRVVRIARRTMRIVNGNLAFTAVYNLAGLSLAAVGLMPPVLAAAAQSIPDLGILANSARLLRDRS